MLVAPAARRLRLRQWRRLETDRPASTAAAGHAVAPAGAPYAFVAPGGFAPTTLHPEEMKAGSHVDLVSLYDEPTVDGLTTLGLMAFDAGEPVTDDPITLGSRVWREIGPGGSDPPPITAGVLGGLPASTSPSTPPPGRRRRARTYRGAAVGSWVVVATCTGAGPAAIAGLDRACRSLDLDGRAVGGAEGRATSAPVTSEAGAPYTFAAPDGFTISDPAIVRQQLGGVPGSLVLRSWENRVLVFASDAGRPLTSIDPTAFCGVVEKILPRTSTTPMAGSPARSAASAGVRWTRAPSPTPAGRTIRASRSTPTAPSTGRSCSCALLLDARPAQRGAGRLPAVRRARRSLARSGLAAGDPSRRASARSVRVTFATASRCAISQPCVLSVAIAMHAARPIPPSA